MGTMRAAVVERYGPPEVARVIAVPRPAPGAGEVLVRVAASEVSSGDARIRGAAFPAGFGLLARLALGLRGPRRRILGVAFSGTVEAVGAGDPGVEVGDAVCGMVGTRMGAHAEHVIVPAGRVVRVPPGVTLDDAAGVLFGGTTARCFLHDLLKGRTPLGPGARVLVNGASGAVGAAAVQLAAKAGADVTGVCSTANVALVSRLGAHTIVDRTREDVLVTAARTGQRYDVSLDTVGTLPVAAARASLADSGTLLLVVTSLARTITARGDVVTGTAPEPADDFRALLELLADGSLEVVHDSAYPLDDVTSAHARVDGGRKVGVVLLRP
jgi:NADPH:quinone reductase-like Zn-dependent oxidoreductase